MHTSYAIVWIKSNRYLHASTLERWSNGASTLERWSNSSQVSLIRGYPSHFTRNSSSLFLIKFILSIFSTKNFCSSSLWSTVLSDTKSFLYLLGNPFSPLFEDKSKPLFMNASLSSSVIPIIIFHELNNSYESYAKTSNIHLLHRPHQKQMEGREQDPSCSLVWQFAYLNLICKT